VSPGKPKTSPAKLIPLSPKLAMFVPKDFKLPKVPLAAGNERNFRSETAAQKASATQALGVSRASSEKMRGLSIVTSIMKKREAAASIKHQDHVVAEKMNYAAERAAMFKTSVAAFDKQKMVVQKAALEVKAQQAVVAGFQKQLKAAQALLKKKKKQLRAEQKVQLHKKYLMEVDASKYKRAKTLAIKLDRKAQERRNKTKQMKYYAKVAESAVEKAEQKAQKASKKVKKKVTKKTKKKTTKKTKKKTKKTKKKAQKCFDCKTLPKAYRKQLAAYASASGKKKKAGSCSDCPLWAKDGYCTNKTFKPFMAKYCRGSCHKKYPKVAYCGTNYKK